MTEYNVISSADLFFFVTTITKMLNSGWSCVGGIYVYVSKNSSSECYYQAMIKNNYGKPN